MCRPLASGWLGAQADEEGRATRDEGRRGDKAAAGTGELGFVFFFFMLNNCISLTVELEIEERDNNARLNVRTLSGEREGGDGLETHESRMGGSFVVGFRE